MSAAQPRPVALASLDVESIRVAHERTFAAAVERHPIFPRIAARLGVPDARQERRRLMASSLRLTESMAPTAHQVAREAQRILGVPGTVELYQRTGPENAAMHFVETPILLEIQGSLLPRLDPGALLALFGHEIGHYMAHGTSSPFPAAIRLAPGLVDDDALNATLSYLSMMCELTADRIGLLACQDLSALMRLMLTSVSGLAIGDLTSDTDAYLAQCKELIEADLSAGEVTTGNTHPEHGMRVYAAWLFSETRTYRELTGRGPGTRELAEVDAIIARCFGADGTIVHDPVQAGDVPREFLECALAAAVIVGHADGELTEDERSLIERVFASEIADWQEYLDPDVAFARFSEAGSIVAASASELGPPLLQLLFDVMIADRQVHPAEVRMILEIGGALGVGSQFARALSAMFRKEGVSLDFSTLKPPERPLPPRPRDVDEALQTFVSGVLRRGESSITLRRLLRLLGSDRRSDKLLAKLSKVFAEHRIEVEPPLDQAGLDDRVTLTPAGHVEASSSAPTPRASRSALVAALRRLREQLVSGDGRSPSVRLRKLRRGRTFDLAALERVSVGMAERVLEQVRARRAVRLVAAGDAGRHGPAGAVATDLLALAREDNQRTEETGARDLYVGYPFLTGTVARYLVRAPLVIYPVELARDGDGARGFRLDPRPNELPIVNQSLLRLVFNKRGWALTDELSDELEGLAGAPEGGPDAVLARLRDVGLDAELGGTALHAFTELGDEPEAADHLVIEELAVLGLFPQSSSDLLQDYDGLLQDLERPEVDVGGLLAAASALLPGDLAFPAPPEAEADDDWCPVVQADPSQRSVIAEARRHGATVIDGPPGTGKSQVIVNLVAEALRRGERVAVVCEKRAALDVVHQRMTSIGFGKALALVHDVHEDRKPLFAHIAGRLEATGRIPFDAAEAQDVHVKHGQVRDALGRRAEALSRTPDGLEMTVGELMTFVAQQGGQPELQPIASLDQVPQSGLNAFLELAEALHPLAGLWGPASTWRTGGRSRPPLAPPTATTVREVEAALEGAIDAARVYEERLAETPAGVTVDSIERARAALGVAVASRPMRANDLDRSLFGAIASLAATDPERLRESGRAQQAWREAKPALLRLGHPVVLEASPTFAAALSILNRWAGKWSRVFVAAWWQARARFRDELASLWPERAGAALTPALLEEVGDRLAASRAWSVIAEVFARLGVAHVLPGAAPQLGPMLGRLEEMTEGLRELGAARESLIAAQAWLPASSSDAASLKSWDQTVDQRLVLLAAHEAAVAAAQPLQAWFPWLGSLPPSGDLDALLARWLRDGERLAEADALLARAKGLISSAPELFEAAARAWPDLPASAWRSGVAAAWGAAWLARLERTHPAVAALGTGADDHDVARDAVRLRDLEVERTELEIERILARLDDTRLLNIEAAAKRQRRTPEQKLREELLKEARKQRMIMPLRTFVRRFAPHGLLDVTPVWLLSPETMAILFPRQPLFDLVVLDEASQCTVESGLPVLLRAKRVVIAGDEKQMPPSSYFSLGAVDDDESLAATVDADERHDAVRDLLTAESLLSLARPRVARTGLAWHYRCRDESLIAFSNHAMYEGELLTIPSTAGAAAPSALHWVPVADGRYEAGENIPEASRVVDVVDELLGRSPCPTIGVVTFNLKQRKAVLDAIDARRASDPRFDQRWTAASAAALDERPFVKNLEQVQGDERDVIVFSLGHAPQARKRGGVATGETYVPARFGPLGQRGGERRLNVAISRAKAACHVVASFTPEQLSVASSKHQGPRLFKHFLEFAHHQHHGRRLEATRVLDLVRGSARVDSTVRRRLPMEGFVPLQTQLALALEAAGIPYEPDVGASTFRVPLAVLDPADPKRYAVALLLHDGTGPSDPFELHVHRPGVLEQRGWKVLTITAASWQRRGNELLSEIEALVPGCRGAVQNDVYQKYRAARIAPTADASADSIPVTPRRPRRTSETPYFGVAAETTPGEVSSPSAPQEALVSDLPPWALTIADELFRGALLYLDRHCLLNEAELMSMVGGPRRARAFARQLDAWRSDLPFLVEASIVEGARTYRKMPRP